MVAIVGLLGVGEWSIAKNSAQRISQALPQQSPDLVGMWHPHGGQLTSHLHQTQL